MKPSLESALGYGLGCALVGAITLVVLGVLALAAIAFPVTLTIVFGTLTVLAFLHWRQGR